MCSHKHTTYPHTFSYSHTYTYISSDTHMLSHTPTHIHTHNSHTLTILKCTYLSHTHILIHLLTRTCTLTQTLMAFPGSRLTSPLCCLAQPQDVGLRTLQPKDSWTRSGPFSLAHSQDLLPKHKPFPGKIWEPTFLSHPTHLHSETCSMLAEYVFHLVPLAAKMFSSSGP